jgi:hypothetical protein
MPTLRGETNMAEKRTPPVKDPTANIEQELNRIVGHMGIVEEANGALRIKVAHSRAFPWDDVFKELLYRDFKVEVTKHKADLIIECRP